MPKKKKTHRVTATVAFDSNGKRIRKSFYGSSKKEAKQLRKEYLEEIEDGIDIDRNDAKVGFLMYEWLFEFRKFELEPVSFRRYESLYNSHFCKSHLLTMKIKDVKAIHLQKFLNRIESDDTARRLYSMLKMFFKHSLNNAYITRNPLLGVINRRKPSRKHRKNVLNDDDIKKLYESYEIDESIFVFIFALNTGLRQGELLGLRYTDIDYTNKKLIVSHALKRDFRDQKDSQTTENGLILGALKTGASYREIPVSDFLLECIETHKKEEKRKFERLNLRHDDECFIITSNNCTPQRGDHLAARWRNLQKELGIEQIKYHDLRHTFCTILAREAIDIKTVSELMGHSDIKTTLKVYTHSNFEIKRKAIDSIDLFKNTK